MKEFEDYTPLDQGVIRSTIGTPIEDDAPSESELKRKPHQHFLVRIFVLFTSSLYFFNVTIVDDLISAVIPILKTHNNFSTSEVSYLYSVSPVTALVFSIFTAYLVNVMKIRTLALMSTFLILLGNTVFIYFDGFWPKLVGRAIFGSGEGPLEVLMALVSLRWFVENDPYWPSLGMAFGVTAAAGMLGASVGLLCIPVLTRIFRPNDILAYSIVNCIAGFTVMVSIVYWVVDYWAEPELDPDFGEESTTLSICQNLRNLRTFFWAVVRCRCWDIDEDKKDVKEEPGVFEILKSLKLSFWLLFTMTGTLWSIIYVIMVYLTDFLTEKWNMDEEFESGLYSSIVFFIGVPFSVGTGWFIGKYGNSISLIIVAGAIFGWSCLILGLTNFNPLFGIVGIGLATGLFEPTVNSATARALPDFGSDMAYSLTAIIFQAVLFAAPIGFSYIHDELKIGFPRFVSYDTVFIMCSSIGFLNIILALTLAKIEPSLDEAMTEEPVPSEAEYTALNGATLPGSLPFDRQRDTEMDPMFLDSSGTDVDSGNKSSTDDSSPPESRDDWNSQNNSPVFASVKSNAYQFTEIMYFSCFCLSFLGCLSYGITLIVIEATEETDSLTWMAVVPIQKLSFIYLGVNVLSFFNGFFNMYFRNYITTHFPVNSYLPRLIYCAVNLIICMLAFVNLFLVLFGSTYECDDDADSLDDVDTCINYFWLVLIGIASVTGTQMGFLMLSGRDLYYHKVFVDTYSNPLHNGVPQTDISSQSDVEQQFGNIQNSD